MNENNILTADLARAARALTKVSTKVIARSTDLSREQVRNFEQGKISLHDNEKAQLRAALEKYGALFVEEDEQAGYGVRRRFTREKLTRLNTWEGEGGHASSLVTG